MNPLDAHIDPDTNIYQGLLMPDIMMCLNKECKNTKTCRRHPDSGTIPTPKYQSVGDFNHLGCNAYWPIPKEKPNGH